MRTTDFSRAPKQGRAGAMLVIEVPAGSGGVGVSARSVAAEVRRAPGHVWSTRFTRRGFSAGVVSCFATAADAESAAAALRGAGVAGRASMTVLTADPNGYSNGVWRAEGNVMAHIPTFTPTSAERARGASGPAVAPHGGTPSRDRVGSSGRNGRRIPTGTPDSTGEGGGGGGRAVTDARAMFIGATKYRGPRALVQLSRTWYPMVARMRHLRGYVWHTVYWEPPFTLGTLAFFASRDDLLAFARLPAHRTLMQWITRDIRNGTGGYIRLHLAPGEAPDDGTPDAPEPLREAS